MKNSMRKLVALLLVLVAILAFAACGENAKENPQQTVETNETVDSGIKKEGLWASATYLEDKTFGEGAKTLTVKVEADGQSVTFTVKSDKETVGDALIEHSLISGENGAYGLYIKVVNGIKADFDTDGAYWSFNKNGEYMMTGVDATNFADGEQYELVYTKG